MKDNERDVVNCWTVVQTWTQNRISPGRTEQFKNILSAYPMKKTVCSSATVVYFKHEPAWGL